MRACLGLLIKYFLLGVSMWELVDCFALPVVLYLLFSSFLLHQVIYHILWGGGVGNVV